MADVIQLLPDSVANKLRQEKVVQRQSRGEKKINGKCP